MCLKAGTHESKIIFQKITTMMLMIKTIYKIFKKNKKKAIFEKDLKRNCMAYQMQRLLRLFQLVMAIKANENFTV